MFFINRSNLPFDKDGLSYFLPWLTAFMVFLAIIASAGALSLNKSILRWNRNITGTLTIQVPATADKKITDKWLDSVLEILEHEKAVLYTRVLDENSLVQLLEPWLEPHDLLTDLFLPRLIDVELRPDIEIDIKSLTKNLQAKAPGTTVDSHRIWLKRAITLIRVLQITIFGILVFIGLIIAGTVVFATRSGLAIHQEILEVLHLTGAHDRYVARQFASRAMLLSLHGGVIGLIIAIPVLVGADYLLSDLDIVIIPDFSMNWKDWTMLVLLPFLVSFIAMATAYRTAMRMLKNML